MAALRHLLRDGIDEIEISRLYKSAPVPISDQPWFVNGVARLETKLSPTDLLVRLHSVEALFGRVRRLRNEARILDLDIVDYDGLIQSVGPILPHPRASDRLFVLKPIQDLAPTWQHPVSGESIAALVAKSPADQSLLPITDAPMIISPHISGSETLRSEAIAV